MIEMKSNRGNAKTFNDINKAVANTNKSINTALYKVGNELVHHARKLMDEKKSGRIYKIKGRFHQSSKAGEAPANLSGDLRRSIDYVVHGNNDMTFGYRSQPGKDPYGRYLEFGTNTISKRPNIFRTVADKRLETQRIMQSAIHGKK